MKDAGGKAASQSQGQGTEDDSASPLDAAAGMLEALQVEQSVKTTRLLRSSSISVFEAKYEVDASAVLGTGMSGGVLSGRLRSNGTTVAVKTLLTDSQSKQTHEQVLAEVQNQLSMDHPNICRLMEVFELPGKLVLVMERLKGPDLYDHLSRKGAGRYFERDAANYVRQMCSAVAYCHKKGICHRDLKLENFCLEDTSEDARVKLIDFGLSEAFTSTPMTNSCGTLFYVAPEVLNRAYNEKCDMWSLGVIAYIMLDGGAPFQGRDDRVTLRLIRECKYSFPEARWGQVSREAKDFIMKLLVLDVGQRMDAEQACAHEWFPTVLDSEASPVALDSAVLEGMRNFTKSNALKRAVLNAVAPVATVERVSHWADQFAALDKEGTGAISVQGLATRLMELTDIPEAEANFLSNALAQANNGDDQIWYTDFLAACLSAHMTLGDSDLRELFDRLDTDKDGLLSQEDVRKALGSIISDEDMEELRAEWQDKSEGCSYADFRWLLLSPRLGTSVQGLRNLMNTHNTLTANWRVDTRKAKVLAKVSHGDDEELEAKRRENATWRLQHLALKREHSPESESDAGAAAGSSVPDSHSLDASPNGGPMEPAPSIRERVPELDGCLMSHGWKGADELDKMTRAEKREVIIKVLVSRELVADAQVADLMSDGKLVTLCPKPYQVAGDLIVDVLGIEPDDPHLADAAWSVATAEAKDVGDVNAARRENLAWRLKQMQQQEGDRSRSGSQDSQTMQSQKSIQRPSTNSLKCSPRPGGSKTASGSPRPGSKTTSGALKPPPAP